MFLEISQNSQEKTCARVSFLIKKEVFTCEFCKISKNTFFTKHLWEIASAAFMSNFFVGSTTAPSVQERRYRNSQQAVVVIAIRLPKL